MTTMSTGQQRHGVTSPAAIELRSVHKHFGRIRAVRGIDMAIAVPQGHCAGVTGWLT